LRGGGERKAELCPWTMIGNAGSGGCWKDGRSCCFGSLGFSGFAIAGT